MCSPIMDKNHVIPNGKQEEKEYLLDVLKSQAKRESTSVPELGMSAKTTKMKMKKLQSHISICEDGLHQKMPSMNMSYCTSEMKQKSKPTTRSQWMVWI